MIPSPGVAASLVEIGTLALAQRDLVRAAASFDEANAMLAKTAGTEHPSYAEAVAKRALVG